MRIILIISSLFLFSCTELAGGVILDGPVSINMNNARSGAPASTPAFVFETLLDNAWPALVIRNNSPGNSAQTQIFMERYDNSSPSPLLMIWQMAFDINDNQGWKGLYNIEAIDPVLGVISTPISLARSGEVGIGASPQLGSALAVNGAMRSSGAATALNFIGIAAAPSISACGTSPAVNSASTNNGGNFATGSGSPTSCSITFQTPFPNNAFCTLTPSTVPPSIYYVSAQNRFGLTLNLGAGASNSGFNYSCTGS